MKQFYAPLLQPPKDKVPLQLGCDLHPNWLDVRHRESQNQREPERNVGVAPLSHSYARLQWGSSPSESAANTSLETH